MKHTNRTKEQCPVKRDLIEALKDFEEALEDGEVSCRLTCRVFTLDLVPTLYSPEMVKKTRKILKVSQTLFARFLGVSPQTVRAWEQGANTPNPMACRFMDEMRLKPDYWLSRLKEAAKPKEEFIS